jgi:transglutaminase-like putative cysteine protease
MVPLVALNRAPDTTAATLKFLMRADSGTPEPAVARALVGGRQTLHGDTLLVERWAPSDSGARKPLRELGAWVDLPVTNPRIRAAAHSALAGRGARTAVDSARELTRWVARAVATDKGDEATAAAVVALQTRSGGPDAKARLLATLAREVGLPARVVSGLAIMPEGSFGHSWTEIWLGRWVAADPTFGHFPASTSLIRLWVAGRSRPLDLLPLGGGAQFLPVRKR